MAWIDKDTLDYIPQSLASSLAMSIFQSASLRLRVRLGSYWADPTLGSKLYLIKKDVPTAPADAKQYAQEAIQPMINDGRLTSITVTTQRIVVGRVDINIDMYPPSGEKVNLKYFVPVGG